MPPTHLLWIPAGAATAFLTAFLFGDLLALPVDLYYLVYFTLVLGFLGFYVKRTGLELRVWMRRGLVWSLVLGVFVGLIMIQGVLARPAAGQLSGALFWWALFWRGLVYGAADGLLLLAFPWVVVWRTLTASAGSLRRRLGAGLAAWLAILFMTTGYHLGYGDFRSRKLVQPNIGSTIAAVPTLLTANPVGSPVSHVLLHIAAVVHVPDTDLFLPPHRSVSSGSPRATGP